MENRALDILIAIVIAIIELIGVLVFFIIRFPDPTFWLNPITIPILIATVIFGGVGSFLGLGFYFTGGKKVYKFFGELYGKSYD